MAGELTGIHPAVESGVSSTSDDGTADRAISRDWIAANIW